nr:MAG TPA: hypothetical protein [Crassvirales sp.]
MLLNGLEIITSFYIGQNNSIISIKKEIKEDSFLVLEY